MSQKPAVERHDEDLLREMYRRMRLIREVETALDDLVDAGEIPGNAHLATGQEAVAVGTCLPLRRDDVIAGTHRSHHHVVAKGSDPRAVIAEFGGRETGVSGGRGGEMHLFDLENGVLETTGMVGANPPHVAGAVLAGQLDGEDRVGVTYFGDGASNQGVVFETMNLAAVWDLPVVFVCENNRYAVTTARDYSVAGEHIADRARAFDIPAETIDGQDVIEVYETASDAVERARSGDGPQFVECETYRYSGHYSEEDRLLADRPYRSDEEIERWREERDPLDTFAARLLDAGVVSEDELAEFDADAEAEIDAAIEFMRDSDHPPGERALENVYANQDYPNFPQGRYR